MTPMKIDAILALRGQGAGPIGRDRIAMLEAVAQCGSITQAAKMLGFSYKAVWDGINAVNNLLPRPALIAQVGGRGGGGGTLTDEGRRLIAAFRRLEEKLSHISAIIAAEGLDDQPDLLLWNIAMKTSARNAFRCRVATIKRGTVDVEVTLELSDANFIVAVITNDSVDNLGLEPGRDVMALVKSSFVMLARADDHLQISARNRILGTVIERIDGGVNCDITVDVGGGKTLAAAITTISADSLPISVGDRVCAFFKASHVILAAD
jgi:molybdate transport system regulatory protein